jgi:DNA adenine methylase
MTQYELEKFLGIATRAKRSIRAPMKYPGNKYVSLDQLLPLLPYRETYVEPFGGSGVVLFNRRKSKLEVFNDRYSGVICFFRALQTKRDELITRLQLLLHSREEWEYCKETWSDPTASDVERAVRWYYMVQGSFGGVAKAWGRSTTSGRTDIMAGIYARIPDFEHIHERLQSVQIENLDFRECIKDYDTPGTVFYLDPPYYGVKDPGYASRMTEKDHADLLELAHQCKGFVALSGYANELYDSYTWDERVVWERRDKMNGQAVNEFNNRTEVGTREIKTEVLWVLKH